MQTFEDLIKKSNKFEIATTCFKLFQDILSIGSVQLAESSRLEAKLDSFAHTISSDARLSLPIFSRNVSGLFVGSEEIKNILRFFSTNYPEGLKINLQETLYDQEKGRVLFFISDYGKQIVKEDTDLFRQINYRNSVALIFQVGEKNEVNMITEYWGRPNNWDNHNLATNEDRFQRATFQVSGNVSGSINRNASNEILEFILSVANNDSNTSAYSFSTNCVINPPFKKGVVPTEEAVIYPFPAMSIKDKIRLLFEEDLTKGIVYADTSNLLVAQNENFISIEFKYKLGTDWKDESRCLLIEIKENSKIVRIDGYRGRCGHF